MLKFDGPMGGIMYVLDSNGDWYRVSDWNFRTATEFAHKFQAAASFWDQRFILFPPENCALFDYDLVINDRVETWRPNILCRFELVAGPIPNASQELPAKKEDPHPVHLAIDVIRSERPFLNRRTAFRSHSELYDVRHTDKEERVLWHELGHAMDQDHIHALALNEVYHHPSRDMDGKQIQNLANRENTCTNDSLGNGQNHCYVTPPWIRKENVMGSGTDLDLVNAKTWRKLINQHLDRYPYYDFIPSQDIARPPRLIRVEPYDPNPPRPLPGPGPGLYG